MAPARFYSVPEITPISEYEFFRSAVEARSSMKGALACDVEAIIQKFSDDLGINLTRLWKMPPDDLPPSFMADHSASLSPLKGWETKFGKWEPKKMVAAGPGFGKSESAAIGRHVEDAWARTTLAFKSKAGKKSNFGMTMYNEISWLDGKAHLEEDITFCRVYRLPKKAISNTEKLAVSHWRSLFGHIQPLDLQDYSDTEANGVGGLRKRPRSKPIVGTLEEETPVGVTLEEEIPVGGTLEEETPVGGTGSEVWHNFTKIYTKDPNVEFAACHHCGGMMKLTGGSGCGTSSPSSHYKTCKVKLRLSQTEAIAELKLVMLGPECGQVAS